MHAGLLRSWRARELLGTLGLGGWALFHLWEQWSAFGGRADFVARTTSTSHGALAIATELSLGILPIVLFVMVDLGTARTSEPSALRAALAQTPSLAARLGRIGKWGSRVLVAFLLAHIVWLWLPKLIGSSEPVETWVRLRGSMGTWPMSVLHAVGMTALAVHVWQSVPRLAIVLDLVDGRPDILRALRASGLIVALGLILLYGQLAGWHASGAGTFWPLGPETGQ